MATILFLSFLESFWFITLFIEIVPPAEITLRKVN